VTPVNPVDQITLIESFDIVQDAAIGPPNGCAG
jgi:hypothetical protein